MRPVLSTPETVVIGASAGGLDALAVLLTQLDRGFPVPVLVVLHVAAEATGRHARLLDRSCPLAVVLAQDGEAVVPGRVYIAPPDRHFLVERQGEDGVRVCLARGPKENRSRPAIDPLFRSALVAYGPRTVGVLLTGLLDDGVAGLGAIARAGGITMVQDPDDALYPDMPQNALEAVEVEHVLPLHQMGRALYRILREPVRDTKAVPPSIVIETKIAQRAESNMPAEEAIGTPAPYACPACSGPLWQINDETVDRFRCHVGHAYTARTLLADQDEQIERALWAALRTLEERAHLLEHSAQSAPSVSDIGHRAAEARAHARRLRALLLEGEQGTGPSGGDGSVAPASVGPSSD